MLITGMAGIIGLLLAVIFGVAWHRSSGQTKNIIERIKAKPRHEIPPSATDVGALPTHTEVAEDIENGEG